MKRASETVLEPQLMDVHVDSRSSFSNFGAIYIGATGKVNVSNHNVHSKCAADIRFQTRAESGLCKPASYSKTDHGDLCVEKRGIRSMGRSTGWR